MYFCTIFLFFTSISAQFLYFSPVSLHNFSIFHPRFGKITVFSSVFLINISQSQHLESNCTYFSSIFLNRISQLCFATVFYKCISPQVESCACEAARLPTGRPVATGCLGVGTGHSWKWAQATDWASVSGLLKLSPQAVQDFSSFLLVNLCYCFVWK